MSSFAKLLAAIKDAEAKCIHVRMSQGEAIALVAEIGKLREVLAEYVHRYCAGGWQLIETAPKDGTRVHLGYQHMQGFDVVAHWRDDGWWLTDMSNHAIPHHPTHWRPLPKCPAPSDSDREKDHE